LLDPDAASRRARAHARRCDLASSSATGHCARGSLALLVPRLARATALVAALALAACSTTHSADPNPPANVNLSGYSLAFRQGYADGCASSGGRQQQDAKRFAADTEYRQGWQDGRSICQRK
jgi:hypothetical protein